MQTRSLSTSSINSLLVLEQQVCLFICPYNVQVRLIDVVISPQHPLYSLTYPVYRRLLRMPSQCGCDVAQVQASSIASRGGCRVADCDYGLHYDHHW